MAEDAVTLGPARERPAPQAVPLLVLAPAHGRYRLNLREIWAFRELLLFLTWRDLKVRYRQTVLGATWAVVQPLTAMVIFSLVFGRLARLPSDGVPYPVFTYAALLPWTLFSTVLTRTTASVVGNANLVSKVYFPRVLIPLSSLGSALVDFIIAFALLLVMMAAYGLPISWRLLALPGMVALALAAATGIGLWLAALNVRYRDVSYVVPFFVQVWLIGSPVAYSTRLVPDDWLWLYGLNPMVGVIEGFRWALLGTHWSPDALVLVSATIVAVAFVAGLAYFHRMEDSFADVV